MLAIAHDTIIFAVRGMIAGTQLTDGYIHACKVGNNNTCANKINASNGAMVQWCNGASTHVYKCMCMYVCMCKIIRVCTVMQCMLNMPFLLCACMSVYEDIFTFTLLVVVSICACKGFCLAICTCAHDRHAMLTSTQLVPAPYHFFR